MLYSKYYGKIDAGQESLKNFPRYRIIKPNSSPKNQNSKNFSIQF